MLGDIVRKGNDLESRRVRVWKAKGRVEKARKHVMSMISSPDAHGDMGQDAYEEVFEIGLNRLEEAERILENAEYEYLRERGKEDESTVSEAQNRACSFSLWVLQRFRNWSPEPMHPFFDTPMNWLHKRDNSKL